ncbi:MAG: hypothetical protein ACRD28_00700 [Acidobacteriaceae bacterium]
MATHPNVKTDPTADAIHAVDEQEIAPFRTLSKGRDLAPVAYMPPALAEIPKGQHLRRILTREQGYALETIGHAVDYLNDCYLYEGDDSETINLSGPPNDALQILVTARQQIFMSAPVREPRLLQIWNAILHRESRKGPHNGPGRQSSKPVSVLPLSSSR